MIACSVVLALFSNCLRDFQAISKKCSESNELFLINLSRLQNMDSRVFQNHSKSLGWTLIFESLH